MLAVPVLFWLLSPLNLQHQTLLRMPAQEGSASRVECNNIRCTAADVKPDATLRPVGHRL
ncbi:MAG: hypothetical protein U1B80_06860 [Anaerolineaceae bacterium]|nr:hypothetical protein [Anaerolineaceae bacterium]